MKFAPLFSIITPSFNRAHMIVNAVESVLNQNLSDVEHIIIDGGSTDGTLDILKKYSHLKVVSEPDDSMYDALNKGLRLASGEIVGFLNTDDYYEAGIFYRIANLFIEKNVAAVIGSAKIFLEKSECTRKDFFQSTPPLPRDYWHDLIIGNPFFNAWFFKKPVFDLLGEFDTSYKIAGDREFLIRFALLGLSYERMEDVVYHYRYHTGSLTMNQNLLKALNVSDENLSLINQFRNDSRMPDLGRKLLRQLRSRETITATSRSIRAGNWKQAATYSTIGFHNDLFWPMEFLFRALKGVVHNLAGKFKTLPPQI